MGYKTGIVGRKKIVCKNCGKHISKNNVHGYCFYCRKNMASWLESGKVKPKFVPRVRVLIDEDGKRSFVG